MSMMVLNTAYAPVGYDIFVPLLTSSRELLYEARYGCHADMRKIDSVKGKWETMIELVVLVNLMNHCPRS